VQIRVDDLSHPAVLALLSTHLTAMAEVSPPESRHALDVSGLQKPEITFWTLWDQDQLLGCGALKALDSGHGEVKSMRTAPGHERRGVASTMLRHLIQEARSRGYRRLSLETGAMAYFEPARQLYRKFGFVDGAPFGSYREDPNSVFMTMALSP
jgi:putative acetyltransferase